MLPFIFALKFLYLDMFQNKSDPKVTAWRSSRMAEDPGHRWQPPACQGQRAAQPPSGEPGLGHQRRGQCWRLSALCSQGDLGDDYDNLLKVTR